MAKGIRSGREKEKSLAHVGRLRMSGEDSEGRRR